MNFPCVCTIIILFPLPLPGGGGYYFPGIKKKKKKKILDDFSTISLAHLPTWQAAWGEQGGGGSHKWCERPGVDTRRC